MELHPDRWATLDEKDFRLFNDIIDPREVA
jgi:hypothetical protein